MKNKILYFLASIVLGGSLTSCNDYLDPDLNYQMTFDEAFSKKATAEKYLSYIYTYLPDAVTNAWYQTMTGCSDDAYYSWTSGQYYHQQNNGTWSPAAEGTTNFNTWTTYYKGINEATTVIKNIEKCSNDVTVTPQEVAMMKAEARCLRAFYYSLLIRQYGPIYIWTDKDGEIDMSIKASDVERQPVDVCIDFVEKEFLAAAADLPDIQPAKYASRMTKGTALAMRARLLLYAARPLYNFPDNHPYGANYRYREMTNTRGEKMFAQTYDPAKWKKAAEAAKLVIDMDDEGSGVYALSTDPNAKNLDDLHRGIKNYQSTFFTKWNKEVIMGRYQSDYSWFYRTMPSNVVVDGGSTMEGNAGYGVSMKLFDTYAMQGTGRFATIGNNADGSPIIDAESGYDITPDKFVDNFEHPVESKLVDKDNKVTNDGKIKAHISCVGREARFYASVLFSGANWKVGDKYYLITFNAKGTSPYGQGNDFNKVGFLCRKMSNPEENNPVAKNYGSFVWPYIRLAEIYLAYAEACNEMEPRDEVNALKYINKVRNRSGLTNLEIAYPNEVKTKEGFRHLLQQERFVELSFEDLRYWDEHSWMINPIGTTPRWGLNLSEMKYEDSWARTTRALTPLVFQPKHCLFPVQQEQLDAMRNMTQTTGW